MSSNNLDPIPPAAYPSFQDFTGPPPQMPPQWSAVALLHPFSPPQSNDPQPSTPFFQLCVANLAYVEGVYFSAQISGVQTGTWWYIVTPQDGTQLSTDEGVSWQTVDMGWALPVAGDWFGNAQPTCAGTSPLNWMSAEAVEWWKSPVTIPCSQYYASTWMWFDATSRFPVRMMYGQGPATPGMGDPAQLPVLQMYSFSYFPQFTPTAEPSPPSQWAAATIDGFAPGNPFGIQHFVWNGNFGMTAFMTPVNAVYNPLPTRVLYSWKPDDEYQVTSDRSQNTLMMYDYNPGNIGSVEALLTGPAPAGTAPPPNSDSAFLITSYRDGCQGCLTGPAFPFPQEAPDWVSAPEVQSAIQATIQSNPVLCPNTTVAVYSVLFPASGPNYPDSTYLWTWYAPTADDGVQSQPVTFMQSQSGVNQGTSLALADYFDYELLSQPIDPSNFTIPPSCLVPAGGGSPDTAARPPHAPLRR